MQKNRLLFHTCCAITATPLLLFSCKNSSASKAASHTNIHHHDHEHHDDHEHHHNHEGIGHHTHENPTSFSYLGTTFKTFPDQTGLTKEQSLTISKILLKETAPTHFESLEKLNEYFDSIEIPGGPSILEQFHASENPSQIYCYFGVDVPLSKDTRLFLYVKTPNKSTHPSRFNYLDDIIIEGESCTKLSFTIQNNILRIWTFRLDTSAELINRA